MLSKIQELRKDVARLACYAAIGDFVSVGSVVCDINEELNTIYALYNQMVKKDNTSSDTSFEPDF